MVGPHDEYAGINWSAAEKARDANYRHPHTMAWRDIPKYERVDPSAGILNTLGEYSNINLNMGYPHAGIKTDKIRSSVVPKNILQTRYGNIIPPATYLRRYDPYFTPNDMRQGIGRFTDSIYKDILSSKTMQLLRYFFNMGSEGERDELL